MARKIQPVETLQPDLTPQDEANLRSAIKAYRETAAYLEKCVSCGDQDAQVPCDECKRRADTAEKYLQTFFSPSS